MWPVQSSRIAYENPWITVREDLVQRPDGEPGVYGVVVLRHPAVFIVAMTDDDEVLLVRVDRHTVGLSLEVPAGGSDGEDPLAAAQRELHEETGWTAREWRSIGRMNALNGVCVAPEYVYLATGLQPPVSNHGSSGASAEGDGGPAQEETPDRRGMVEEGIDLVELVPWPKVLELLRDGSISDGETVAALMYAALTLGRVA